MDDQLSSVCFVVVIMCVGWNANVATITSSCRGGKKARKQQVLKQQFAFQKDQGKAILYRLCSFFA